MKKQWLNLAARRAALAPKIKSRVTPFASRAACYKSDGIEELSERVKQFNEDNKQLVKEAKEARETLAKIEKEYTENVGKINKELTEKGATLDQIQKEVVELKAKNELLSSNVAAVGNGSVEDLISKSFEDKEQGLEIIKSGKVNTEWRTDTLKKKTPWKAKAAATLTLSNNVTGGSIVGVPTFSPEIATRGYDDTQFRDLFPVIDSATGTYVFYRSNTPPGEGSIGTTTPGSTKNQMDKDLTMQIVNASYKAGFVDIAKESLQDIPMLQSFLNEELVDDYLTKETADFLYDLVSTVNGPVPGTGANLVEKMIYGLAAQRQLKYRPNFFLLRAAKWAELIVTKPQNYNLPVNSVIITPQGTVSIVGMPVYVTASNGMDDSHCLVGDNRRAAVMQVVGEGLKMELFKDHDKAIYQNLLTMRVEARVALIKKRLDAFSYLAV